MFWGCVCRRTTAPSALTASAVSLFVEQKLYLEKKKVVICSKVVRQNGDGLCHFRADYAFGSWTK